MNEQLCNSIKIELNQLKIEYDKKKSILSGWNTYQGLPVKNLLEQELSELYQIFDSKYQTLRELEPSSDMGFPINIENWIIEK